MTRARRMLSTALRAVGLHRHARSLRQQLESWRQRHETRNEWQVYQQFLGPGSLCFDVGAHRGDKIEDFLKADARVIGFEPLPFCIEHLQARFGADPDKASRVVIVPCAVGAAPGKAELHIGENASMSSMSVDWIDKVRGGRLSKRTWPETVEVDVRPLDDLIDEYGMPDFCKIDVEGYEVQVLAGLSKPIRALSFEFTPEDIGSARQCLDRLAAIGPYRYNLSFARPLRLELAQWIEPDRMNELLDSLSYDRGNQRWGDVFARLAP